MGSQNSQPDPDPDETRDESTESGPTEDTAESQPGGLPLSRRATLASLIGIGGLNLASSPAAAKKDKTWKKDRDADGNDLLNLGALTMADNPTEITDFTGANLGVANGKLSAAQWNKDVDAGGNDLTNLGSASASIVNADTLSDNGSGTINLGALVDADKNELKQLGAVAMQQNKTKIVDFAGANLSIDSSNVLNAITYWRKQGGLLEPSEDDVTGIEIEGIESSENEDLNVESDSDLLLSISGGQGTVRIETEGGHEIVLDDADGSESLSVEDSAGNSVEMDSATGELSISANEKITLDAPQIDLSADVNVNIESDGLVDIESDGLANIKSAGPMDIRGAIIGLNGTNLPAARKGDSVEDGVITSGSTTVFIG